MSLKDIPVSNMRRAVRTWRNVDRGFFGPKNSQLYDRMEQLVDEIARLRTALGEAAKS